MATLVFYINLAQQHAVAFPRFKLRTLLRKRLRRKFSGVEATVRMDGTDGLSVYNGKTADREQVEETLQETWEVRMTGLRGDLYHK